MGGVNFEESYKCVWDCFLTGNFRFRAYVDRRGTFRCGWGDGYSGGSSIFTELEYKTLTHDLDSQELLSMVAKPKTPYGKQS